MICKGKCPSISVSGKKYELGYKYCSTCRIWSDSIHLLCSCCRTKFRTRPRTLKDKNIERAKKKEIIRLAIEERRKLL